jgi:hypothetical protein
MKIIIGTTIGLIVALAVFAEALKTVLSGLV